MVKVASRPPSTGSIASCVALLLALVSLWGVNPGTAAAATFAPPEGRIYSGASVEWPHTNVGGFAQMTGQPKVAIIHGYSGFLESLDGLLDSMERIDSAAMISWRPFASTPSGKGGTLQSIASGNIDGYLIASARAAHAHPRPVFLRPMWEMNGDWFPWSSYAGSTPRAGNSPALYRMAWQRMHIIFRGGQPSEISARLSQAGLPGLTTTSGWVPNASSNVAWVWSLAKGGARPTSAPYTNSSYYPGDQYVDWIGLSFHQWSSTSVSHWTSRIDNSSDPWARADDLHAFAASRGKPMMLAEWGIASKPYGNGDDPSWINDAFSWASSHRMVRAQVYFNRVAGDNNHRLEDHPKSRAAFSSNVASAATVHDWRVMLQREPLTSAPGGPTGAQAGSPGATPAPSNAAAPPAEQRLHGRFVGVAGRRAPASAIDGSSTSRKRSPARGCGRVGPLDLRVAVTREARSDVSVCGAGKPVSLTITAGRRTIQGVIRTEQRATRLSASMGRRPVKVRRAGPKVWRFSARRPSHGKFRLTVRQRGRKAAPMALRINANRSVAARVSVTTRAKAVSLASQLARHRVGVRASAGNAGLIRGTVKLAGAAAKGAKVRVVPATGLRRANARKWTFRGGVETGGLSVKHSLER